MKIHVVVQTCPQRRALLPEVVENVRASDIGDGFEVMEHPEGLTLQDFFMSVMARLRDSGADYGVRMEDDVFVAKHFLHNIRQWGALQERDFGAGWLFASQGMMSDRMRLRRSDRGHWFRPTQEIHCALAVLLPVKLLREELYERMEHLMADKNTNQQDFAMSRSVWDSGRRCYIHWPPLVENRLVESVRGHHNHTAIGHAAGLYFEPSYYRRPC